MVGEGAAKVAETLYSTGASALYLEGSGNPSLEDF